MSIVTDLWISRRWILRAQRVKFKTSFLSCASIVCLIPCTIYSELKEREAFSFIRCFRLKRRVKDYGYARIRWHQAWSLVHISLKITRRNFLLPGKFSVGKILTFWWFDFSVDCFRRNSHFRVRNARKLVCFSGNPSKQEQLIFHLRLFSDSWSFPHSQGQFFISRRKTKEQFFIDHCCFAWFIFRSCKRRFLNCSLNSASVHFATSRAKSKRRAS